MSTILVFCVLATAGWLVLSLLGRVSDAGPKDSVDDFSRALSALASDPGARPPGSPRPRSRRPASRPGRPRRPRTRPRRDPLSTR